MWNFIKNNAPKAIFGVVGFTILGLSIAAIAVLFPPAAGLIAALAATPLFAFMGAAAFPAAVTAVSLVGAAAITSGILLLSGAATLVGKLFNRIASSAGSEDDYYISIPEERNNLVEELTVDTPNSPKETPNSAKKQTDDLGIETLYNEETEEEIQSPKQKTPVSPTLSTTKATLFTPTSPKEENKALQQEEELEQEGKTPTSPVNLY